MKKIFLLFSILFFVGCSTKINEIFDKDQNYIKLSQYTQRGEIVNSLETIAIISATYLNNIEQNISNNEKFLIGIYIANDNKKPNNGIYNKEFNLTLNNQHYTKVEPIQNSTKIVDYPFYNKWMNYYYVYFPTVNSNTLTINYSNIKGNIKLTIPKKLYLTK